MQFVLTKQVVWEGWIVWEAINSERSFELN